MNRRYPGPNELARGARGERRMLAHLCDWRDAGTGDLCRPDFLWVPNAGWPPHLIEVKDQDAFEPPPFWGHGLNKRQFDVYMAVWRAISLATLLVVFDPGARMRYWDFLHLLADGPTFVTNGPEPRIIFPLESFTFQGSLEAVA